MVPVTVTFSTASVTPDAGMPALPPIWTPVMPPAGTVPVVRVSSSLVGVTGWYVLAPPVATGRAAHRVPARAAAFGSPSPVARS